MLKKVKVEEPKLKSQGRVLAEIDLHGERFVECCKTPDMMNYC